MSKITSLVLKSLGLTLLGCLLTVFADAQTDSRKTVPQAQVTTPANGQPTSAPNGTTPAAKPAASAPQLLKITIGSSRPSVTKDGSYGVFADFENVSQDIVTISPNETMLVVQPEVSQPNACVESEIGIFPALPNASNSQPTQTGMRIQPSEHYKVFWDLSHRDDAKTNCSQQAARRDLLGFVPGDYAFTVEGIAYASATPGQTPTPHTYTETTTLHVSISQTSTALAAFIGALLAYLVVALQPGHDFDRWRPDLPTSGRVKIVLVLLRNMLSAGLLGAAVTIVASRLSDTQFPLKVSVNDFWGALTIGFIAYFIGTKFIATIASRLGTPPPTPAPVGGNPGVNR